MNNAIFMWREQSGARRGAQARRQITAGTPPGLFANSALEVRVAGARFTIEQTPVSDARGEERGVVAGGSVGTRRAGRLRIFRYEIRRWRDGRIPDIDEAVGGPRRLTDDEARAQRVLDLVPLVPTPVWGRDELNTGGMWNSNSVIAWLIARSRIDTESIRPPTGGRAPGWQAGLVVARRQEASLRDSLERA